MAEDRRIEELEDRRERLADAKRELLERVDTPESRRQDLEEEFERIERAADSSALGAVRPIYSGDRRIDVHSDADVVEGAIHRPGDAVETGADDPDRDRDYNEKSTPA